MIRAYLILGIIQLLVAIGAIPAGYLLIANPDGSGLGMTPEILSGSPFKNFLIPGLFLFIVNGLFSLTSSILTFFKFRYAWFTGIFLGSALAIWVIVQVYSIGLTHFLQPAYFIIGASEIILSIYIFKKKSSYIHL